MQLIKKHFWNIIFVLFLGVLFLNPFGLGMNIKSTLIKMISGNPSVISENNRKKIKSYDWKLETVDGEIVDFNDLKGKVVFVNFWATWCPPCVAEMPSIQKLYKDYGKKVTFVVVANDKPSKVNAFIKEKGYTMPIFYSRTNTLVEFSSKSIPTSFLLDKKGEIVIDEKGAANWNSQETRKIIDGLL